MGRGQVAYGTDTVKVIFLDFDGVLNSLQWWKSPERAAMTRHSLHARSRRNIDPANVAQLQRIVEATGAKIVISSAWRHAGKRYRSGGVTDLRRYLQSAGLRNARRVVIDCTPHLPNANRGLEIRAWLDRHGKDVTQIVIIDDERHSNSSIWKPPPLVGGGKIGVCGRRTPLDKNMRKIFTNLLTQDLAHGIILM